jgi:hypothetical protein
MTTLRTQSNNVYFPGLPPYTRNNFTSNATGLPSTPSSGVRRPRNGAKNDRCEFCGKVGSNKTFRNYDQIRIRLSENTVEFAGSPQRDGHFGDRHSRTAGISRVKQISSIFVGKLIKQLEFILFNPLTPKRHSGTRDF